MGRGFLSGIFWGGIVSLVALFVSHEALDRQTLSFPKPETTEVEVPGGSEFNQARPETDPVVPSTDTRPGGDTVAEVAVPEDEETAPPTLETSALEVPVPTTTQDAPESLGIAPDATSDIAEPDPVTDSVVGAEQSDTLVSPEPPASAPETIVVDPEPLEVAPAQEEEQAPLIIIHDKPEIDAGTDLAALPDAEAEPADTVAGAAPQVTGLTASPAEPNAPEAPVTSETAELPWLDQLRASQIDEAPDAPELPSLTDEPSLPPVSPSSSEAPTAEDSAQDQAPVEEDAVAAAVEEALTPSQATDVQNEAAQPVETEATDDAPGTSGGSFLQPVETFTDRESAATSGVGTGSLPVVRRLGDSSAESEEADPIDAVEEGDDNTESDISESATDGPALTTFATAFDAPEGVPLLSIVLIHQGDAALGAELLEILPPNVAFAVDASLSSAADIARAYRAAGREVVMIPALPSGAAPQDIEQALGANFDLIPEAVAVMDVSGASFQSDRAAVEQVVDVVAASGHGMITFPRGLNPAHQAAQRAGVPTGLIFRNLDGASESQETIRRNLDRAAFRARQDEAVILVGTTGSTMLSALTEWVLGNRAAAVAIAPISTALGG